MNKEKKKKLDAHIQKRIKEMSVEEFAGFSKDMEDLHKYIVMRTVVEEPGKLPERSEELQRQRRKYSEMLMWKVFKENESL